MDFLNKASGACANKKAVQTLKRLGELIPDYEIHSRHFFLNCPSFSHEFLRDLAEGAGIFRHRGPNGTTRRPGIHSKAGPIRTSSGF